MCWDIQTVTPGDYTVSLEISTYQWNEFKIEYLHNFPKISPGYALKLYLRDIFLGLLKN